MEQIATQVKPLNTPKKDRPTIELLYEISGLIDNKLFPHAEKLRVAYGCLFSDDWFETKEFRIGLQYVTQEACQAILDFKDEVDGIFSKELEKLKLLTERANQ